MTYPNVMVMGYLKATGQLTPEMKAKLETAIVQGYQKLLSFENPNGGFGWHRTYDSSHALSAYALMILADMAKVYAVDPDVIRRTEAAIWKQQEMNGSFGDVKTTAYVAWALLEAGTADDRMTRCVKWLEQNWNTADAFTIALCANVFARAKSPVLRECAAELVKTAEIDGDAASWTTSETVMYGRGVAASVEATALAVLALVQAKHDGLAEKGLTALVRAKDSAGGWHATQPTVLAIKALIAGTMLTRRTEAASVSVKLRGRTIPFERITSDVQQQVSISEWLTPGENAIELSSDSDSPLGYQIVTRYYMPWSAEARQSSGEMQIETSYSKTEMALDEEVECTARVRYTGPDTFMVIADVAIPSGFVPETESLEALRRAKKVDAFTVGGRSVTFYLGKVRRGRTIELSFTLRPRFVVSTRPAPSRAYEYYNPQNDGYSIPARIVVRE